MSKERYFSNVDEAYTYEGFCRDYLEKNKTSDVEVENDCIINMVSGKVGILKISLIGDPDLIEDINEKWDIYWDTHGEAILKESEEYSKILEELRKNNPPIERKNITFSRTNKEYPWESEPDRLEFIDEETGFKCIIKRDKECKHLCGYVVIPEELTDLFFSKEKKIKDCDVHGDVTLFDRCDIRKSPEEEENLCNIVGFDCAHYCDLVPAIQEEFLKINYISQFPGTYRDINFVEAECRKLAKQIKNILDEEENPGEFKDFLNELKKDKDNG